MVSKHEKLEPLEHILNSADTLRSDLRNWYDPSKFGEFCETLSDFMAGMIGEIEKIRNDYWSFVDDDGEVYDADFDSQEEVLEFLSERMYKELEDNGTISITQETEEDVVLVRYRYDDETNERVITERVESTASCVGLGQ